MEKGKNMIELIHAAMYISGTVIICGIVIIVYCITMGKSLVERESEKVDYRND